MLDTTRTSSSCLWCCLYSQCGQLGCSCHSCCLHEQHKEWRSPEKPPDCGKQGWSWLGEGSETFILCICRLHIILFPGCRALILLGSPQAGAAGCLLPPFAVCVWTFLLQSPWAVEEGCEEHTMCLFSTCIMNLLCPFPASHRGVGVCSSMSWNRDPQSNLHPGTGANPGALLPLTGQIVCRSSLYLRCCFSFQLKR